MPTSTVLPRKNERKTKTIPLGISIYSPGYERFDQLVRKLYGEHDLIFRNYDDQRWQTLYGLLNHCAKVERVSHAVALIVAEKFGWSAYDIALLRVAALSHDLGKTDPVCWKYRSTDKFSTEERREFTKKHQLVSKRAIMNLKSAVRAEDRPSLVWVALITGHHHDDPHEIPLESLRAKCMVIRLSDIFVSSQEDRRYQQGKSQWTAVKVVHNVIEDWRLDPRFAPYIHMAEAIGEAIEKLYGPENIRLQSSE